MMGAGRLRLIGANGAGVEDVESGRPLMTPVACQLAVLMNSRCPDAGTVSTNGIAIGESLRGIECVLGPSESP